MSPSALARTAPKVGRRRRP